MLLDEEHATPFQNPLQHVTFTPRETGKDKGKTSEPYEESAAGALRQAKALCKAVTNVNLFKYDLQSREKAWRRVLELLQPEYFDGWDVKKVQSWLRDLVLLKDKLKPENKFNLDQSAMVMLTAAVDKLTGQMEDAEFGMRNKAGNRKKAADDDHARCFEIPTVSSGTREVTEDVIAEFLTRDPDKDPASTGNRTSHEPQREHSRKSRQVHVQAIPNGGIAKRARGESELNGGAVGHCIFLEDQSLLNQVRLGPQKKESLPDSRLASMFSEFSPEHMAQRENEMQELRECMESVVKRVEKRMEQLSGRLKKLKELGEDLRTSIEEARGFHEKRM